MQTTDERQTTSVAVPAPRGAGLGAPVRPGRPTPGGRPPAPSEDLARRAARRTLRRQIARLELRLAREVSGDLQAGGRGRVVDAGVPAAAPPAGARLLTLGELEDRRDALVRRLAQLDERRDEERANRELLAAIYRDPAGHRWVRLETADLAERGCRVYEVRPVLGVVGILTGWWRVRVSSGCPLPGVPDRRATGQPIRNVFSGGRCPRPPRRPRRPAPALSPAAGAP
jgi:hypothetical protein